MILWLSSYPKSGNTWARIFLTNYLFEDNDDPFGNIDKIRKFMITNNIAKFVLVKYFFIYF